MQAKQEKRWAYLLPRLQKEGLVVLHHPSMKNIPPHSHLFFELTYITQGSVEHTVDGKTATLRAGDYFLVDYGSIHGYRAPSGSHFANLDCVFLPEFLDPSLKGKESLKELFRHDSLNFHLELFAQNPAQMIFHDEDGSILSLLQKMKRESRAREPAHAQLIRCYLVELLLLTLRRMDSAEEAVGNTAFSSFLTAYAAKHYTCPLSLSDLAAKMNYSLPYVSKRFKEETGLSFVQYVQGQRIRAACRLLLTTKKSVGEIAEQVGYRDVKFFTEKFKSHTGLSPLQYRKKAP